MIDLKRAQSQDKYYNTIDRHLTDTFSPFSERERSRILPSYPASTDDIGEVANGIEAVAGVQFCFAPAVGPCSCLTFLSSECTSPNGYYTENEKRDYCAI